MPVQLTTSRAEVAEVIQRLIEDGESLLEDASAVSSDDEFGEWVHTTERWHARGKEALRSCYGSDREGDEFFEAATGRIFTVFDQTIGQEFANR